MLNKSAATDARHSRSGKDAMLYNSAGKPFAQVESFTTKGSFNNYKYAPLGQNRELEVNGTVGVTVNISEIVVLDGQFTISCLVVNFERPVTIQLIINALRALQLIILVPIAWLKPPIFRSWGLHMPIRTNLLFGRGIDVLHRRREILS